MLCMIYKADFFLQFFKAESLLAETKFRNRILEAYLQVVEVLEFNTLGIYLLRRQLRHTSDGKFAQRIAMLVGVLRCFANRLHFLAKRIISLSAHRATKPPKINEVCDLVECTLSAYMNEVC